jgi:hypothetical protein
MRAVPLVRAWLYSLRGFVVMTASLAIALSIAITGPPTDSELKIVGAALADMSEAASRQANQAAIELCPDLPPEAQAVLCAPAPVQTAAAEAEKPPPIDERQLVEPVAPVEIVEAPPLPAPIQTSAAESQLLGAPQRARPQRVERPRAERPRRAATQRASTPRRSPQQTRRAAQTTPPPRPLAAQVTPVTRPEPAPAPDLPSRVATAPEPPHEPAPEAGDASDRWARSVGAGPHQEAYRGEERDDEYDARQERRRERRERRRRYYEREYAPPDDYYEEEPYPDEELPAEDYPDIRR